MLLLKSSLRMVAVVALLALSSSFTDASSMAKKTTAPVTNDTMSVGDGTTVNSTSKTTVFLGTEYNPNKCVLQFASLDCFASAGKDKDKCGDLNGYPLECTKLGRQNGKDKIACQCRANETEVCQNSTAPTTFGAYQFDGCSDEKPCVDSYGHVPSKLELRICAEKIHCVKEVNTTATQPASICHTCRSCIAQNDAAGAQLKDKRRFDCTKICPKEILDSLAERNKQGAGIADGLDSGEDSGWGSGSGEESGAADDTKTASGSGSKAKGSTSAASVTPQVSAMKVVLTIVATAVAMAMLH